MRKWASVIPVAVSFGLSAAVFQRLPASSLVDVSPLLPIALPPGEPAPRSVAFLLPAVALGVWLLFRKLATVRTGRPPLPSWWLNEETGARAVQRFEPTYNTISFAITSLIALMHAGLIAGMLGSPEWVFQALTALLGLCLIAVGNVIPRTKPNWIVGLRTKRTLGDPAVWFRTHRILGMLMMVTGSIVVIMSLIAPAYTLIAAVGLLLASFPIAYVAGVRPASASPRIVA